MYDYHGLLEILKKNNLKKSDLVSKLKISSRTIAKISKGEKISKAIINKLCLFLNCKEDDIFRIISKNKVLQTLRDEMEHKIRGGLYHKLQILMTYNSNHIEGNSLNEEQTRLIYETRTFVSNNSFNVDDIIETSNHFKAINYCINNAEKELNEEFVKQLHFILKSGTECEFHNWIKIGDYKTKPNMIGDIETSNPKNVAINIKNLLDWYNKLSVVSFENIIDFHYKFELIHPFQDGNGRVGRLIAFKECLRNNIIPFIIEDKKKWFYYHGLQEYKYNPNFLIETCYDGQDTIKYLLDYFEIKY